MQQSSGSWSRLLFFACSGNGNGQSWNNQGSNGNYWSRSLNSQTNGRNLNFNSGGVNPQNNNNRFNGFTRRAVQHSSLHRLTSVTGTRPHGNHSHDESRLLFFIITMSETIIQPSPSAPTGYRLTRQQLLYDLYVAFYDAARHKHKMSYVQKFEANLAENLNELCDDLLTRRYEAQPSKCFRRQLSQEARGVRGYVPRPHRASSLLPLYPPTV
jgi:hypothetical protein